MGEPESVAQHSSHSDETALGFLREAYERIAYIRAFEAKVHAMSRSSPPEIIGSVHLCAGQEAVPLGALAGLREDDPVIATYRGHAWALAAGVEPVAVMAEICHRAAGLNGGRAGSAFMMAPDTRFIAENSIVGAGATHACGVALAGLAQGHDCVVTVSLGDGAMNQGAVHEAFAFAVARDLPVIFVCENNGWSELTATTDMFRIARLARRAAGYGMQSSTINGSDPVVVRDTFSAAAERVRSEHRPVLIECLVPRLWGHYNRDIEHYRSRSDKKAAQSRDPLQHVAGRLMNEAGMSEAELEAIRKDKEAEIEALVEEVLDLPYPDPATATQHVTLPPPARRTPSTDEAQEMTYVQAVNAALQKELESDPRTVVFGEDVGKAGGIFGASRNLQDTFGAERVFDTPIAENAILGTAVGASIRGLRPIVEIMWADFVFVAFDQLINQASNIRYITQGRCSAPLVVRMQQGVTPGSCAQHSQSIEALLAHIPGLKVALAATPQDAYSLLRAAAADPDPCVIVESRALYWDKGPVALTEDVESVGQAWLCRRGEDLVIVTWGTMVKQALEAARQLEEAGGADIGVLDLRWLNPLDEEALREAVSMAGGKALIVHEAVRQGGFGAEVATRIHELCGDAMPLKVARHTTPDTRIPASPLLQAELLPNAESIAAEVRRLLGTAELAPDTT